jgi:uncharacterized protein
MSPPSVILSGAKDAPPRILTPTLSDATGRGQDAPPNADRVAPVDEPERVVPIDVLRGVVLLGILTMNVQSFSMPGAAYMNPTAYGDLTGANWWVWATCRVLFDSKMYGIFAMLFGAGIVLMTSRVEARGRRAGPLHYRRMAWLLLFGVLHAFLLWSGDILYTYAVCGMLAFPFRRRSPRALFVAGGVFVVIGALIWLGAGLSMPSWPPAMVTGFEHDMWRPTPAQIARELATYRSGWLAQMPDRADDALSMETIFMMFVAWKTLGLMLVGMGLLKARVFDGTRSRAFYARMLVAGAVLGAPLAAWGIRENVRHAWDVRYAFFLGDLWNYWGSFFVSFAWVALVLLVAPRVRSAAARLAAVGRTALSNYILDTLLCTTLFYGHGFGLFGKLDRVEQVAVVLAVWVVQLVVSPWWLRRFRFGPLEWLWRSLTYWRRQPMLRTAHTH